MSVSGGVDVILEELWLDLVLQVSQQSTVGLLQEVSKKNQKETQGKYEMYTVWTLLSSTKAKEDLSKIIQPYGDAENSLIYRPALNWQSKIS